MVAVSGLPGNSTTFYFGAVDGGIWKTTDAGTVWNPIFDHQSVASIGAIAVAPSDPNVIYAGTGESDIRSDLASGDGVYRSNDGGQSWQNVGLQDCRQISKIVVDPQDANVVYVGALGHAYAPNEERGVYKSSDGGAHWQKVLDQGPEIGVADLAIASGKPKVLFASTWHTRRPPWSTYGPIDGPGSGLFRSQDGGETWSRLTGSGLPDGDWGRVGVAVAGDGKRVYAVIDDGKKSGLYRSDDGGESWTLKNSDPRLTGRAWYFGNITVDPKNPDVIYIPNVAVYRSEDGGQTISIVRGAPGGDDYHQIWIDPADSSRMILGTDQGATISLDYGKTWSTWYNQPTAQLYHVITDNRFPYTVYGEQQDSGSVGILSRTDHSQITARDWLQATGSESGYIAPDPKDPNILYVTETYGSVARFDLRTSFSQNITPWPVSTWGTEIASRKYRDPWTPVLLFSAFDHTTLYLGTQYVMKTIDGGLHWQKISPDLTGAVPGPADGPPSVENAKRRGYGVVYTIAASSLEGGLIWAGSDTGLIHLTRDGGNSWKDVTPAGVGDWSKISFIEASRFNPAEAYAAVDRHRLDDRQPYIYRTRDYGKSWQSVIDGIHDPAFVYVVREDPKQKGLLFAGTEFGIYVSFDDGDYWQSLQLNLPVTSVRDLVVHGDDLVVATHGRSFWILDDMTALRQAGAAKQANVWLYRPAEAVRVDNDGFLGTPLPPEEPAAENPPDGAVLEYFLRDPAKQVKLEILDGNQNVVRSVSSDDTPRRQHPVVAIADRWFPKEQIVEKSPGMHRFVWNLRWGSSEASPAEEGEFGAPRGPRAVPGNYEVRLTVDGKSSLQPLRLVMDPRSTATPEELRSQFELGRKIFDHSLQCRAVLSEIRAAQKQVSGLQPKLEEHSDLKASVSELEKALQAILHGGKEPSSPIGLERADTELVSALGVVESSDRAIPAQAVEVYEEAREAFQRGAARWKELQSKQLNAVNRQLESAGIEPVLTKGSE